MKVKLFQSKEEYWAEFDNWQKCYAWFPININGTIVWLENLERIREASWDEIYWKYRLPEIEKK